MEMLLDIVLTAVVVAVVELIVKEFYAVLRARAVAPGLVTP